MSSSTHLSEIRRIKRVSDMQITAHAILRDRFLRRATALDLSILILSIWIAVFSISPPNFLEIINPTGMPNEEALAGVALILVTASIVQFKVDWKGKSIEHQKAVATFNSIKQSAQDVDTSDKAMTEDIANRIKTQYIQASQFLPSIPENEFLSLKAKHKRKVFISKAISKNPGASVLWLRLKLPFRG